MENELWKDFINDSIAKKELLDTYLELRLYFQDSGFSEQDLENPPFYTATMFRLYEKFNSQKNYLFNQLNRYGFNISKKEFIDYISSFLEKINELTPLKNGNN